MTEENADEPNAITEDDRPEESDTVWGGAGVASDLLEVDYGHKKVGVYVTKPTAQQLAEHDKVMTSVTKGQELDILRVKANLAVGVDCIDDIRSPDLGYCGADEKKELIHKDMVGGVQRMRTLLTEAHPGVVNAIATNLFLHERATVAESDPLDIGGSA